MIKWIIKWIFRLALLAVALVVAILLSLNTILRILIEHNIRARSGMDAEIGRVELGWTEPTIEIRDLKIYNPPSFGGTPFLNVPEIHIEYDRAALLKKELHLTLLRFNLAELDIVRNRKGQINIFTVGKLPQKSAGLSLPSFKKETGYDFAGIDALNVSFDKAKYIDLQNSRNNREQRFGLQNCVVPDVKCPRDLAGLALLIDLKSDHFFDPLAKGQFTSAPFKSVLNVMGGAF
ncbi:MAG: hypothetical protein ACREE6_03895 [Limisphaerales bacterium]